MSDPRVLEMRRNIMRAIAKLSSTSEITTLAEKAAEASAILLLTLEGKEVQPYSDELQYPPRPSSLPVMGEKE